MKDYKEEDYLLLSGIQHYLFCKRQWALIHIEQLWQENVRTIEGAYLHKRPDQPFIREKRGEKLVVRAMPVHSREMGITGICDVVEFVKQPEGITLAGEEGCFVPVPVEYKRGKPKKDQSDISQLTAQAMCLEEMLVCEIKTGYMYYHEIRHREEVIFTDELKGKVKQLFADMHHCFQTRHTPRVKTGRHCQSCSLQDLCVPSLMKKRSVSSYIEGRINE
ncbi:CRISPR-associated protein Cas4 [Marinicrinis sediminis]|uniref:CRISPR-associated exonuclease Cas4 n=1 Tax=Marinicrinis sediminis TaxID=1652465 RepID=A0ABW5RD32_9BACL